MGFREFEKKAAEAIAELRKPGAKEILIVHHDDADGLCSAAIMKATMEREGFKVRAFCLEKVYGEVVDDLHKGSNKIIIYSDIGSAHVDFISKANSGRNLTIILDHHHDPPEATDALVFDLNLERFGFEGDTEFSGATCNYLFARLLDRENINLSYLALVASREIPGDIVGLNKMVLDEAVEKQLVKVDGKRIKVVKLGASVDNIFAKLQILGAVGYYEGGPELGIQACLNGITAEVKAKVDEWEEKRKNVNKRLIGWLYRERLKEMRHLQWFDAGNMYKGMGTKVIGQFCSYLSYRTRLIKPDKYIFGFMNVQPEVPGWEGKLAGPLVKVSVRVPKALHDLIDKGKMRNAVDLVVRASQGFGIADGHKYAANVAVSADRKDALLENADAHAMI
ncbi:MAG TPA: DHH family phosphoesterase [Candidatus Bathyarchaeia archaeon]|nr:DHH family phosphoesterase [Candidatus Bathyarchaeia archaeon]